MIATNRPLVWLHRKVKTPPFSFSARIEAGFLLRQLQQGMSLSMPHSRPMPEIGARCHELRITDDARVWRIIYRIDRDAVVILKVFDKKTRTTPKAVIETCKRRLRDYDHA
ncbi:MAG: type II toxin-antitoxin system RelE/ParE family toxin [Deltaproteobacteria bacterium]|nr:type II toxin-antitoxin system RelE/ParE family toxin [Deltaproteobacteria bacterium]